MNRRDGVTLSVALSPFDVTVDAGVDIEVQMKDRAGIENVFASERSNDQVLAAGVALRLKVHPEKEVVLRMQEDDCFVLTRFIDPIIPNIQ